MLAGGVAVVGSVLASCSTPSSSPELSRVEAIKLLEAMGDTNIVIAAIVNGVGVAGLLPVSGPNVTFVSAYTERNGQAEKREQTFFHDKDLGWVLFEVDTQGRRVRLWTTTGYRELKPIDQR